MEKTIKEHFIDWFAHNFGYGYGDGELHVIPALLGFLAMCPSEGNYDYETLEKLLTPTVAWLLINDLCNARMLEYGTSPRFGWLDPKGVILKDFMLKHTADELYEMVTGYDERYYHCSPTSCNCGPKGYQEGKKCNNPLF